MIHYSGGELFCLIQMHQLQSARACGQRNFTPTKSFISYQGILANTGDLYNGCKRVVVVCVCARCDNYSVNVVRLGVCMCCYIVHIETDVAGGRWLGRRTVQQCTTTSCGYLLATMATFD